ncbi:farnesol dehydrogenase-like isoform X2 [Zophobas morio]|uniref:farnesol dehydrogenase-like isoform X2 n=1 Tax=Zophobas morio TaxID=2755281 RepID=UPI003083EB9E
MVLSMERWKGKVAIVTGASVGIGAAIVEQLVEQGLQVVGLARRSEQVEENAKKLAGKNGKLHAFKADISKEEDILKAFKWVTENLGPVHILINNAGIIQQTTLVDGDAEKWKKIFDTNVIGLSIATREAVKIMKENKIDGHIIHINSTLGHKVVSQRYSNVYPASKYAVTALTETLRQELNHLGLKIKISSVSPGPTASEFARTNNFVFDENMKKMMEKRLRVKTEDIADGVIYVLSTPPHVQFSTLCIRRSKQQD